MMKAGYGERCVTPETGCRMEGFNRKSGAASVHDDLFVRALYLTHNDSAALILAFDLLFMERENVDGMKAVIRDRFGLEPSQVLINFSHTHSGPRMSRWHYSGVPDPAYLDELNEAACGAIEDATRVPRAVSLYAGRTTADIPISRRRPDENGKAQWGPYADGPVCNELPVCVLKDERGDIFSILFSVSCHPTINHDNAISAEYPGVAMRELNKRFETRGAIFLQGAGGDTKPRQIAVGDDHFTDGTWADVETVGIAMSDGVGAVMETGLAAVEPELVIAMHDMDLALDAPPDRDELERMLTSLDDSDDGKRWVEEMLDILSRDGYLPSEVSLHLHGLQLGKGVRMVGVEAELGSELGNLILDHYADGVTFPLGYTNGSRINLPCDRQLPEGGYGVDTFWEYHWPAPFAPGIDDRLSAELERFKKDL